jgi:hypothetical protein
MKAEPTHSQVADRPFSADLGGNEDVLQAFGKPSAPRSDGNLRNGIRQQPMEASS